MKILAIQMATDAGLDDVASFDLDSYLGEPGTLEYELLTLAVCGSSKLTVCTRLCATLFKIKGITSKLGVDLVYIIFGAGGEVAGRPQVSLVLLIANHALCIVVLAADMGGATFIAIKAGLDEGLLSSCRPHRLYGESLYVQHMNVMDDISLVNSFRPRSSRRG
jgi:hypothetical protein